MSQASAPSTQSNADPLHCPIAICPRNEFVFAEDPALALIHNGFHIDTSYLVVWALANPSTLHFPTADDVPASKIVSLHWHELQPALELAVVGALVYVLVEPTTKEVGRVIHKLTGQSYKATPRLLILFGQDERQVCVPTEVL